ncbi:MAG: ABC transporter permease [Candidatus Thermoplasmatota archaeon]
MIFGEALRMAMGNLWSHRMRSMLTILGVIIGVGSVLAVVTLGASFEESIVGQFDSIDQKTVYVYSSVTSLGGGPPDCQQFCNIFTDVDRAALANLTGVDRVTVSVDVPATSLSWQGHDLTYERLTATVPESDEVRVPDDYASGGPFVLGQPQVILGSTIAELIALSGSPEGTDLADVEALQSGDAIDIRFPDGRVVNATVAGIFKQDTTFFGDRNTRVYVPVDPFYNTTRPSPQTGAESRVYAGFTVIAGSVRDVEDVRDEADAYIQERSDARLLKIEGQDLSVDTASDIQGQISAVFSQVTLFIGAIGGVSLLVGAIGIANIMLVSVTERTREIGVMKAIGAKDREILTLFLLEAILIGLVGSLFGIALGFAGGAGVVKGVFAGEDVPLVISYEWLGYSVAVGLGVGVVAGFLPARRATKIQPIQALAYE